MNGAPELIELDLRENNFTESGLTVLVGVAMPVIQQCLAQTYSEHDLACIVGWVKKSAQDTGHQDRQHPATRSPSRASQTVSQHLTQHSIRFKQQGH